MVQGIKDQITRLRRAIQAEKAAELEDFRLRIEKLPLKERREQGYSWHPVVVNKSGYTYGERAYVIVERTSEINQPHRFRSGATVSFYTLQPSVKFPKQTGVLNFVERNRMKIILNSRDLPDWLNIGQIGVDLLFDDRTYGEMEKALRKLEETTQGRLAEIRDLLLGKGQPLFEPENEPVNIPHLNSSQNAAISQILRAEQAAVIHGPPGTGKTTTLVQAVKMIAQREATVLVTAPSNTAVDLLTERLANVGLSTVRIGHISRVDDSIIQHTLEAQMAHHPESKNLKKVKIQAGEYRKQARRFRRKFGSEERDERRNLYRQAGELEAWAKQLEERLIDQILSGAQVITATLVGTSHPVLGKRHFRTVVIDEAAQALEPATWIPILRSSRVILAGDPFQLPPTVKSREAVVLGLEQTLIERCIKSWSDVSLLNVQYRMHHAIMEFSNQQFYNGALRAADEVKEHQLGDWQLSPVVFLDTAGCGFEEKTDAENKSRSNPEELHILMEHFYQLLEQMPEEEEPSIAFISPYREQVTLMEQQYRTDPIIKDLTIQVKTIDGFQGQERDIVYISLVRSNGKSEIGFLKDIRRMNVAMTRARKLLVVVGDSATIGNHPFYQAFIEYVEKEGLYQTAWEYLA